MKSIIKSTLLGLLPLLPIQYLLRQLISLLKEYVEDKDNDYAKMGVALLESFIEHIKFSKGMIVVDESMKLFVNSFIGFFKDVSPRDRMEAILETILEYLYERAKMTDTEFDDKLVATLENLLLKFGLLRQPIELND